MQTTTPQSAIEAPTSPTETLYSVSQVAEKLDLTEQSDENFHGANPTGNGAQKDGFTLFIGGNAYDRKLKQSFKSVEVAEMAGIEPGCYEPCVQFRAANPSSTTPNPKFDWARALTFDYTDENGDLLYQIGRIGDGENKLIRPRKPNLNGGWDFKLGDVRRVLYLLPDILKSEFVFLCEGEKAASKLNSYLLESGFLVNISPPQTRTAPENGKTNFHLPSMKKRSTF